MDYHLHNTMFEGRPKSSSVNIISAPADIFTNVIQVLQHRLKSVWTARKDYVEKETLFVHIPWEYLGQPMNFAADPRTFIYRSNIVNMIS